jgi:branched-chain amino acid transport system substrate-binding protein
MNRFARRFLALPLCIALFTGVACGSDSKKSDSAKGADNSKADIKVGAIFDLSGATADIGTPYSEGIRDYIDYKNGSGGVEGHKLALSWQDFKYDPTLAGQLYGQYISEGAKVFMGWGTADTEALRPRVTSDKVPFMSASNAETLTDPSVTPYNFFPGASYSQQMRIILQYISDKNKGKKVGVAVFHHDSPFGTSPLEDGKKYIADKKLDIDFKSYVMPKGATDYVAQIGQAKSAGAKYIIVQNVPSPAAVLATNLAAAKTDIQLVCLNYCGNEIFVKKAGAAAEKMIAVVPFAPPVAGGTGLEEINAFLKAKGSDAIAKGQGYVQGWYTMAVMIEGIKNALTAGGELNGESIKAGLEKITDFKTGVSDPIHFSSTYHAGLLSAPLYQVEGGQFKKIQDPIKVEK